jgi:hypothetical protein
MFVIGWVKMEAISGHPVVASWREDDVTPMCFNLAPEKRVRPRSQPPSMVFVSAPSLFHIIKTQLSEAGPHRHLEFLLL